MTDEKPISEQLREAVEQAASAASVYGPETYIGVLFNVAREAIPAIERLEAERRDAVEREARIVALLDDDTRLIQQQALALASELAAPSTPEPLEHYARVEGAPDPGPSVTTTSYTSEEVVYVDASDRGVSFLKNAESLEPETAEVCAECGHDSGSHPNRGGNDEHCFRCAGTGERGWWHPFKARTERSEPVGEERSEGEWERVEEETDVRGVEVALWRQERPGWVDYRPVPLAVEDAIEAPWKARAEVAEAALREMRKGWDALNTAVQPWLVSKRIDPAAFLHAMALLERALSRTQEAASEEK